MSKNVKPTSAKETASIKPVDAYASWQLSQSGRISPEIDLEFCDFASHGRELSQLGLSISKVFESLIGLEIWHLEFASAMAMFQIGAKVLCPSRTDPDREVGEFGLHVDCTWRILTDDTVLFGLDDFYQAEGFEAGRSRLRSQFDEILKNGPLIIDDYKHLGAGGLRFHLSNNHKLEIFPDSSERETWRLLNNRKEVHYYLVGSKLESSP